MSGLIPACSRHRFQISVDCLGDMQVNDFDVPTRLRILPRYKPRERALINITFLGYQADKSRHNCHLHTTSCANTLAR
jgi:hypothetical protein